MEENDETTQFRPEKTTQISLRTRYTTNPLSDKGNLTPSRTAAHSPFLSACFLPLSICLIASPPHFPLFKQGFPHFLILALTTPKSKTLNSAVFGFDLLSERMDGQGNAADQLPYGGAYSPNQVNASALGVNPSYQYAGNQPAQLSFTYQQLQQQQNHDLDQQLQAFWASQYQQIENLCDFKNQSLPLARIKKIMKFDGDVRMISAEAPVVFARACEMFILELTLRSWHQTEGNRRRTLQRNDISAAVARTDLFDFLVDIVPREEDVLAGIPMGTAPVAAPTDGIPFYPIQATEQYYPQVGGSGMMMGGPELDPRAYGYPNQSYMAAPMWPQPGEPSSPGN